MSPTFGEVFEYAAGVRSESIVLPLREDYGQDVGALARTAKNNYRDVGFVYLCTPNNPTGIVVTKQEVKQLLDGVPEDVPVLIDEAYHHYVDNPSYASSIPYVLEGRQVIVARTFSKIYGLAGMRLGYAVGPAALIERMRPHCTGSINALVKWGGVTALSDTAAAERSAYRHPAAAPLDDDGARGTGYRSCRRRPTSSWCTSGGRCSPSSTSSGARGVLVGRPFPPMLEYLRVSVGTPDEMRRFLGAFKEIVARKTAA